VIQIPVEELALLLKPLTKDELLMEADAWQALLQEQAQAAKASGDREEAKETEAAAREARERVQEAGAAVEEAAEEVGEKAARRRGSARFDLSVARGWRDRRSSVCCQKSRTSCT
jgi:hypothetical protein